ncbi:matrixin family metalloprotease [Helcococcus kunzii]|uniref:matrixin family metalloprotease n=1 Tax=Helcococcus kunzii TaxID=40091 RepID=UPI0024AD90E1|nr:matrixin family metalloprotease [Helcococcus kunzii]
MLIFFYLDSSNRLVPNPQGKFPTKNYVSGSAIINIYYVHDDPNWKIQNTMMHEVGHILGLKHSNTSGALLVSDSAKYNKLVPPQYDDIAGVRSIYK